MKTIVTFFATLIPLIFLDALWIMVIARNFYANHMGFLFNKTVNYTPVMFFYPLYAFGIMLLAVLPAVASSSWIEAVWRGALLGLVSYGAYDLTNHATIANWPLSMTLIDMAWGMSLTALTSIIAYMIIVSMK